MPKAIYSVYVIELSRKVFTESAKFRAANPQFNGVLECLYVGMTSKTPKERFIQHKTGHTSKKGGTVAKVQNWLATFGRELLESKLGATKLRRRALRES